MLFTTYDHGAMIDLLVGELIVGMVYFLLAAFMVHFAERRAIRKGTLELF